MSPGLIDNDGSKREENRADEDELTEYKFIKMIRILQENAPRLNQADVDINRQDRLGRSVVHLSAQYGLMELVQLLLKPVGEGGFGANQLQSDINGHRPLHYAVMFKHQHVFKHLL